MHTSINELELCFFRFYCSCMGKVLQEVKLNSQRLKEIYCFSLLTPELESKSDGQ